MIAVVRDILLRILFSDLAVFERLSYDSVH
jgi:hypothetical protein